MVGNSRHDKIRSRADVLGLFAAVLMIIVGWLNFCYGLAAVLNDDIVVVGGKGAIIASPCCWTAT